MTTARLFGRAAESEAERFLRRKGYRIVERNLRSIFGELDLVVRRGDLVVFVEVKARRTAAHGGAPYAVSGQKQARLVRLAAQYLAQRRLGQPPCRFDVVLCTGGTVKPDAIQHIENAFDVPGDRWQG